MTHLVGLAALVLMMTAPTTSGTEPKFKITPTVTTAEKGKVFEILLRIETDQRLDSILVVPTAPENFCIRVSPIAGLGGFQANGDGSAFISSLAGGSAMTLQFRVAAPTERMASGSSCPLLDGTRRDSTRPRTLDNTHDTRQFVFNAQYRLSGVDSLPRVWSDAVTVKYTTSQAIFLAAGMFGVFLGYLVKSLTARKNEADTARAVSTTWYGQLGRLLEYVFGTSIDKLLTSLVLGFGGLLVVAKAGIPIGGAAAAMALGISLGVLADDALISRVK
jgi:hypothetical protein